MKNIIINPGYLVLHPNSEAISSTSQGQLPLSTKLSYSVKTAIILPQLKSAFLVLIGQLCDNSCDVLLNKEKPYAVKQSKLIFEGNRNFSDVFWGIPVQKQEIRNKK